MREPIWMILVGGVLLWASVLGSGVRGSAGTSGTAVLVVVNQGDRNLSLVDPVTAREIGTVSEEQTAVHGHEVAVAADGRVAYVPIYGSAGVGQPGLDGREMVAIDIARRKIVGRVDFGHGVRPHCVVYEPVSGMLYVTTELDNSVTIVDPRTLKITGSIPTGQAQSHMLAISHDGRRGYTANVGPGSVSVLDMGARTTIAVIPVSGNTQRISISSDDRMVFTADQTKPQLAVIDTGTNKVKAWVTLPSEGYGTAATRDGRWLLVAMPQGQVAVVDLGTLKVARTIDVPGSPQEIVVRPDGLVAYVSCMRGVQAGQIAVIDLAKWTVQSLINAGVGADGLAWAGGTGH